MLLPSALDHYQLEIQGNMLAKYQYMLSVPASVSSGNKLDGMLSLLEYYMDTRTDNKDVEKFSAYSLNTMPGKYKSEEIVLYGVEPDSQYIHADLSGTVSIFPVPMRINSGSKGRYHNLEGKIREG